METPPDIFTRIMNTFPSDVGYTNKIDDIKIDIFQYSVVFGRTLLDAKIQGVPVLVIIVDGDELITRNYSSSAQFCLNEDLRDNFIFGTYVRTRKNNPRIKINNKKDFQIKMKNVYSSLNGINTVSDSVKLTCSVRGLDK